jgi:hypothetical protein
MKRLAALQQAVRDVGHRPPSKAQLLSALVLQAPDDGAKLEDDYLQPYRLAHPEEDQPR